jgi:hypothetical protein
LEIQCCFCHEEAVAEVVLVRHKARSYRWVCEEHKTKLQRASWWQRLRHGAGRASSV